MGAEIFDVEINLDGVLLLYATKVSSKKNNDSNTKNTFNGDVTIGAMNTGGTISIEGLHYPTDVESAVMLENLLDNEKIKTVVCAGTGYTAGGDPYRRTLIGTDVTVTSDEDDWSVSDGVTQKLEFTVNKLVRTYETI